jgi:hypothetical protein
MASPPTDESILLFTLLSDGRWHKYSEIKKSIAVKVAPGRALRAYESRLNGMRKQRGDPMYNTKASEAERIDLGRLEVAQATVSSWANRGIEVQGSGNYRLIRVKPGFKSWGLPTPAEASESDENGPGVGRVTPGDSEPSEGGPAPGGEGAGEPGATGVAEPGTPVPIPHAPGLVSSSSAVDVSWWSSPEGSSPSVIAEALVSRLASCPECGLLVGDFEIHKLWHARQEPQNPSSGPVPAQKIFEDLLDRFQVGMQTWMLLQFSQLEAKVMGRKHVPSKWRDGNPNRQGRQDRV